MTPPANRGGGKRSAPRGGSPRGGAPRGGKQNAAQRGTRKAAPGAKQSSAAKKKQANPRAQASQQSETSAPLEPLTLGFVRGVAPSKWAKRWARAVREQPLELVPVGLCQVEVARTATDVLLERVAPGRSPAGTASAEASPDHASDSAGATASPTRHALRLYEEGVALVLEAGHELAARGEVGLDELALVSLISHPDHHPEWPAARPWQDDSWAPRDAEATLELVATGIGGALMAFPLARHLAGKRTHAVVPVTNGGEPLLPGTEIWASWRIERDANDVQRLIGVLRGRTARSSR